MHLQYQSPLDQAPGTIAKILDASYAELVAEQPEIWGPELEGWKQYDREIYDNPETIGACAFVSVLGKEVVGFGSWDPRQAPRLGIIGHNCILAEHRGNGFGSKQVREILRRLGLRGTRMTTVLTMDHPFFIPAQKNYLACGFTETRRFLWDRSPRYRVIEYRLCLGRKSSAAALD